MLNADAAVSLPARRGQSHKGEARLCCLRKSRRSVCSSEMTLKCASKENLAGYLCFRSLQNNAEANTPPSLRFGFPSLYVLLRIQL